MVLYSFFQIETFDGESIQLIKLRNPVSTINEYIGSWSRDSSEWDKISSKEKDKLGVKQLMDGEFW